jgi:hypothetical protein
VFAYLKKYHDHAFDWLELSYELLAENKNDKSISKAEVLKYLIKETLQVKILYFSQECQFIH